jgi:hypothetical protein
MNPFRVSLTLALMIVAVLLAAGGEIREYQARFPV